MRRMVGDRIWERLPPATRTARRAEGVTLQAEVASLGSGPVFDAARIRIPVIVGRGGKSGSNVRRAARELAAALPMGELSDVSEAGHGTHLTHPAELANIIRRAVARA
jgi:pimeloyl-ACP methyl ester carboxylesterase